MTQFYDQVNQLIDASDCDRGRVEHTLTDGYAHALSLEAEKWRLERRMTQVAQALQDGDHAAKARELTTLAERLDHNAGDLTRLRSALAVLRRHLVSIA